MKKREKNCGHLNEGWGKKYHHDYECFRQWQVIKIIEDFFNFVHGNSRANIFGFVKKYNINCHNWKKGFRYSKISKKKMSLSKLKDKNPMWKGNNVGYGALHDWIKNRITKSKLCEICKERKPLDLSNKSGKYLRELSDWEWICRSCHMKKDGRILNLKQFRSENNAIKL